MATEQWYACVGVTKNGGRCRNQNGHCTSQHEGVIGLPDAVLVKIRVNLTWSERLQGVGVQLNIINWAQGNARRVRQAENIGRDPNAYRKDVADGGVPVFGPDGIDGAVSVFSLSHGLMEAGLRFTGAHLERREGRRTDTLVIAFSQEGEFLTIAPEIQQLLASSWKTIHVWGNPPNENGKVVSTVNIGHRLPDVNSVTMLVFAGGVWGTVAP